MTDPKKVIYLTAGAGGMFCGSCLNDNALAQGLSKLGVDVQLVPTYTPIRTDEEDVSIDQVFFGGINVYLQQKFPPLRYLPRSLDRILNNPKLIRWATSKDVQADPNLLGDMTVSMLRGGAGFQRKEVKRLLHFLTAENPDVINFTNVLIAGCAREIRNRLRIPIVVTLQGDDIFLDYIPDAQRTQAINEIRQLAQFVDAFVVHSQYYADYMSERLGIPRAKITIIRLGIAPDDYQHISTSRCNGGRKRIGYLARLSPEKGLHVLVDAFTRLGKRRSDVELRIAGWLGTEHKKFADEQFAALRRADLGDAFSYVGAVNRSEKVDFLSGLDLFTVPTTYREPKGRFALEAMASGIPVVLPDHGAFPEIVADTGGGMLFRPADAEHLADQLELALSDSELCGRLGAAGRQAILQKRTAVAMAQETLDLYTRLCEASGR